jgi:AcrR family transcriptional regulator
LPSNVDCPVAARRRYHSPARQRQAKDTRRRILDAARDLFRRHGYAGTTLDAIAGAAGFSPKTVVAAFTSKRGILGAFFSLDCPASSAQTQKLLGWRPVQLGLIADLEMTSLASRMPLRPSGTRSSCSS